MNKSHFLNKLGLCPTGEKYCKYSEGETCPIFTNDEIFETEGLFDCAEALKKLRHKPRSTENDPLDLFK